MSRFDIFYVMVGVGFFAGFLDQGMGVFASLVLGAIWPVALGAYLTTLPVFP